MKSMKTFRERSDTATGEQLKSDSKKHDDHEDDDELDAKKKIKAETP